MTMATGDNDDDDGAMGDSATVTGGNDVDDGDGATGNSVTGYDDDNDDGNGWRQRHLW